MAEALIGIGDHVAFERRLVETTAWCSVISCGAATVASSGFFDIANIPPWDTWIAMFRTGDRSMGPEYLVSWVPDALLQDAAAGIDVNPEGCIIWLSETSTEVAARLRASGLLT